MNAQGQNYLANQFNATPKRAGGKRLGDRTMSSNIVDGKRYFSSLDAEIFFGERYIDEIVQINWSIEQATMPLFGYNSYTFDDLAIGARQITGNFVVNFTKSGFMYEVLKNVQAISRNAFRATAEATESSKLTWASHFDKEHSASWDRSFNIRVGYGDYTKKGNHSTMIVLYCVQLTGCQQMLSTDGGVIGEVYSFIAKDIRYDMDSLPEKTPEEENDDNKEGADANKKTFVYSIEDIEMEMYPASKDAPISYKLRIKSAHDGGEVTGVHCKLKRDNRKELGSASIELGNKNEMLVEMPSNMNTLISNCIADQKRIGVKDDNFTLYADFTINHSVEGVQKLPLFKKNIKMKVKKK